MTHKLDSITLHFSSDGRLPYSRYADWIVFDSFIKAVYGSLTELKQNGLCETESNDSLIDSIEIINKDFTLILIKIKKGAFFQQNNKEIEFTAEDLKFSYSIPFFLTKEDIFEKSDLLKISGMDKITSGDIYSEEKVTGIKILDRYTVSIMLNSPDLNIIKNLCTSNYPIVSKYFYLNKQNDTLSPGLGRYSVLKINKKSAEVTLKRKVHSNGYPDYIIYNSSSEKKGDIFWSDSWGDLGKKYKKNSIKNSVGTLGLFFNYKSEIGKNESFRKSINYIINRKELCNGFEDYLLPNNEVLPKGYWGRIEAEEKFNMDLAKNEILKVKNIPDPLIIDALLNEGEINAPYITRLLDQIRKIGLNPILKIHEGEGELNSDLSITAIAVPYKNPSLVFHFFTEGSVYKNSFPKYDKNISLFINKLNLSFLNEDKIIYSKILSKYFYDHDIFIPLWDFFNIFYINEDIIESLGKQTDGINLNIWEIRNKR